MRYLVFLLIYQVLRLHLDYIRPRQDTEKASPDRVTAEKVGSTHLQYGILAGVAVLASIGVLVLLKRSNK